MIFGGKIQTTMSSLKGLDLEYSNISFILQGKVFRSPKRKCTDFIAYFIQLEEEDYCYNTSEKL